MQGVVKGFTASPIDARAYTVIFQDWSGKRVEEVLQQKQVEELALNIFCSIADIPAKYQVGLPKLEATFQT